MLPLTVQQLQKLFPSTKVDVLTSYVDPLSFFMGEEKIDTKLRICAFLAQVGHESAGLAITKENLNYGAQGLMNTFKKYFPTMDLALQYERQPEKIANRVYADRMGNGPESSGDGWKYRGRGLIQLTGKENYTNFATERGLAFSEVISYLETPDGASESAVWFWKKNNLNQYADISDMLTITKRINGGTNGLDHRMSLYKQALDIFV